MVPITYIALAVAAALIGIDQLIKMIVQMNLQLHESVPFIPGVIHFTYVENTGAAFNFFDGQRWLLIILTGAVVLFLLGMLAFRRLHNRVYIWCSAVILAGGTGNLIDRIFRGGCVVDYVELKFIRFAVFNFADSLVVVGVFTLLIYLLFFESAGRFHRRKEKREQNNE